ncbi:ANR family transcriptional regulator [Photobacterium damselae subsp. damselae]|uniref:ANR family transcriptional regulator n=1 Tax=Photobacterium damselae TaxID=38293 RepID=UPI00311B110A
MRRNKKLKDNDRYMITAQKAAKAERSGEFGVAGGLWETASELSQLDINRAWAESRSLYCRYSRYTRLSTINEAA